MYKYALYKFDQKIDENFNLDNILNSVTEDVDSDFKHHIVMPKGSYKVVDFNGETIFITKRGLEEGDLIMFCDEEDCVEYYRIEKVKI